MNFTINLLYTYIYNIYNTNWWLINKIFIELINKITKIIDVNFNFHTGSAESNVHSHDLDYILMKMFHLIVLVILILSKIIVLNHNTTQIFKIS